MLIELTSAAGVLALRMRPIGAVTGEGYQTQMNKPPTVAASQGVELGSVQSVQGNEVFIWRDNCGRLVLILPN
jgi:hypothetical protein